MGTARQMTLPPDRAFCRSMPRQQQSCGHSTTGSAVCASVIRGLWSGGAKYSTVADGPVYCRWRHSFRLETQHVRVFCQWMAGGKEFGARGEREPMCSVIARPPQRSASRRLLALRAPCLYAVPLRPEINTFRSGCLSLTSVFCINGRGTQQSPLRSKLHQEKTAFRRVPIVSKGCPS